MTRATLLVAALAAALAGCGGGGSPAQNTSAPVQLTEVRSIDDFRKAFEADDGVPRLVLIFGPT